MMAVRQPFRAGSYYPADKGECDAEVSRCLRQAGYPASRDLPRKIVGGIVPHAQWARSGSTTARVFSALGAGETPRTFVVFGAVHVSGVYRASLMAHGAWKSPLGDLPINGDLAAAIRKKEPSLVFDDAWVHRVEHSIEVLVPFIQKLFPDSRFVPIMVPPIRESPRIGAAVAEVLADSNEKVVVLGSTDLTHYGEDHFGFAPAGGGVESLDWVKQVNDRRIIDLMLRMKADEVLEEVRAHHNSCGPGAIAATIAAAKGLGARKGYLLQHTTSHDERPEGPPRDFVGYAALVFA